MRSVWTRSLVFRNSFSGGPPASSRATADALRGTLLQRDDRRQEDPNLEDPNLVDIASEVDTWRPHQNSSPASAYGRCMNLSLGVRLTDTTRSLHVCQTD